MGGFSEKSRHFNALRTHVDYATHKRIRSVCNEWSAMRGTEQEAMKLVCVSSVPSYSDWRYGKDMIVTHEEVVLARTIVFVDPWMSNDCDEVSLCPRRAKRDDSHVRLSFSYCTRGYQWAVISVLRSSGGKIGLRWECEWDVWPVHSDCTSEERKMVASILLCQEDTQIPDALTAWVVVQTRMLVV